MCLFDRILLLLSWYPVPTPNNPRRLKILEKHISVKLPRCWTGEPSRGNRLEQSVPNVMAVRMVHRKVALSVFTLFLVLASTSSTEVSPAFVEGRDCKWFLTRAPLPFTRHDGFTALRWRTTSQTAVRAKTLCKN